jgi:soluble lytic murein transglycosylase-like protein
MRSVALSPFIEKQLSPGSQSSGRLSISPNPAFARYLETVQRINQPVISEPSHNGKPFSGLLSPQVNLSQQTAARNGRALLPPPRFTYDTRLLSPSSTMLTNIQVPRRNAYSQPTQPDALVTNQKATVHAYGTTITATAHQLGVDPALSLAVARAESGVSSATVKEVHLNPRAVSASGSVGLFQLQEATGKEQLRTVAPGQAYNPFNPSQNIRLGVSYLKEMAETFSEDTALRNRLSTTAGANTREVQRLAIAAYNAGPGRVARAQALARAHGQDPAHYRNIEPYLPHETRHYVKKVEQFASEFREDSVPSTTAPTMFSDLAGSRGAV